MENEIIVIAEGDVGKTVYGRFLEHGKKVLVVSPSEAKEMGLTSPHPPVREKWEFDIPLLDFKKEFKPPPTRAERRKKRKR